jgi:hypothetical protein
MKAKIFVGLYSDSVLWLKPNWPCVEDFAIVSFQWFLEHFSDTNNIGTAWEVEKYKEEEERGED